MKWKENVRSARELLWVKGGKEERWKITKWTACKGDWGKRFGEWQRKWYKVGLEREEENILELEWEGLGLGEGGVFINLVTIPLSFSFSPWVIFCFPLVCVAVFLHFFRVTSLWRAELHFSVFIVQYYSVFQFLSVPNTIPKKNPWKI